tara:strand:+ start:77 stop:502 length:426 start_codon:yes stop_codon:yes gene_type:complete
MEELFKFFSNTATEDADLTEHNVETQRMYTKQELKQAFEQMYLETLRARETAKTYKGTDMNIILGTSKGFIEKLKDGIDSLEDEGNMSPSNFKDRIYFMFYMCEPKNLMDILWVGHMLGSKSMLEWQDGVYKFDTPEGYND